MLKKAYVEITNRCNLACSFCPKTKRAPRTMSAQEFDLILSRLEGYVQYVYLHVMGEPLLHPELTTLYSFEGNDGADEQELAYLEQVWDFAEKAAKKRVIVALRLWNDGGADARNGEILDFLRSRTGDNWPEMRNGSFLLRDHLYLERAGKFDWPDLSANESGAQFCYGLRDQLGVLVDGTVVPCCLDHEGDMALGNLFTQPLTKILNSPRACALREGFSRRKPAEELCRRCGFAARFNK